MIVTEAAGGLQRMQHDVPTLADFPCCEVPSRAADSRYPPLQWQQRAAKVAVHRIATAGFWLQVLLDAACTYPGCLCCATPCCSTKLSPAIKSTVIAKLAPADESGDTNIQYQHSPRA